MLVIYQSRMFSNVNVKLGTLLAACSHKRNFIANFACNTECCLPSVTWNVTLLPLVSQLVTLCYLVLQISNNQHGITCILKCKEKREVRGMCICIAENTCIEQEFIPTQIPCLLPKAYSGSLSLLFTLHFYIFDCGNANLRVTLCNTHVSGCSHSRNILVSHRATRSCYTQLKPS